MVCITSSLVGRVGKASDFTAEDPGIFNCVVGCLTNIYLV